MFDSIPFLGGSFGSPDDEKTRAVRDACDRVEVHEERKTASFVPFFFVVHVSEKGSRSRSFGFPCGKKPFKRFWFFLPDIWFWYFRVSV